MKLGLRSLLFLALEAALLLALIGMGLIMNQQLEKHFLAEKKSELTRVAVDLSRLAVKDYDPKAGREKINAWARDMGELGSYRVSLINADGLLYGDSLVPEQELDAAESHALRPEVRAALESGRGWSSRFSRTLGQSYLYAAARVDYAESPPKVLRVGASLDSLKEARQSIMYTYLGVAVFGLALASALLWLATRGLGRDFREILRAAGDLAGGDLRRRLMRPPRGELGQIGQALNHLAENLSRQMAETEENLAHLSAVLESMDEGVLVLDQSGQVARVNRRFGEMSGLSPAPGSLPGETLRHPELAADFDQIKNGRKPPARLLHNPGPPESFIEVKFTAVGPGQGAVAVFHDLTGRQRLYQMRRDFVANISHELRTPLTAIGGAVEALSDRRPEDPALRPYLNILRRQCARLSELAADLLELARLEELKAQPLKREPIKVRELFQETLVSLGGQLAGRLEIDLADEEMSLSGDRGVLRGALINLLENAAKYGAPDTPIILKARREEGLISLSVANQGRAIPPEDQDRIFERFYRGAKSRQPGGSGLGLAIVKHAALIHGGRVDLSSPPAGGAVFSLRLPLSVEEEATQA